MEDADERAITVIALAVALANPFTQRVLHVVQFCQPGVNGRQFLGSQGTHSGTMRAVVELQQLCDLGERKTERLGLLDKPDALNGGLGVAAAACIRLYRPHHQTAPLVIANGFHMNAYAAGKTAYGETEVFHDAPKRVLDCVSWYGGYIHDQKLPLDTSCCGAVMPSRRDC